jgi:ketosteroid isomerase-like protein
MMRQANVEVVETMFAAFLRGDYEAAIDAFDPSVVGDFTHMPDGQMTQGRDQLWEEVTRWVSTWKRLDTGIERIIEAGPEVVVVVVEQTGVARSSGIETTIRYGQTFTVSDGQIVRMATYLDAEEALEAAGLSQQDAHG